MLKSRSLLTGCVLATVALLAACDSGAPDEAQENADIAAHEEALTGTLDRSLAGEALPEFSVIDPDGTELVLGELAGQPVLLNLWATWCAPCVVEMPLLDDLAGELEGQVRVITVSEDSKGAEAVVPFFEQRDLPNLPRWMDPRNDLAMSFGGGAVLPLTILYDAEGKEVWRVIGAYDWGSEDAKAMVLEAVATEAGSSAPHS